MHGNCSAGAYRRKYELRVRQMEQTSQHTKNYHGIIDLQVKLGFGDIVDAQVQGGYVSERGRYK